MLLFEHPSQIKPLDLPHPVCTVGMYDGIHLGHKKIIKSVVSKAIQSNGTSIVITFRKHPFKVLNSHYHLPILTLPNQKLELLEELGVDVCILMNFNKNISQLTAQNWIKEILWKQIHIKDIFIGRDSYFGKGKKGTEKLLKQYGKELGFNTHIVNTVRKDKEPISSTIIRNYLFEGKISKAKQMLGRDYSVIGKVVKGSGKGRKLGFPTANLEQTEQCLPKKGVYAVKVILNGKIINAVANIGERPTIHKKKRKLVLEVHLFKKNLELYDKTIEVIFIKRLRNELEFENTSLLTAQIKKDVVKTRNILI